MNDESLDIKILSSALIANIFPESKISNIIGILKSRIGSKKIIESLGDLKYSRKFNLAKSYVNNNLHNIQYKDSQIIFEGQKIGTKKILYKSPLPGELQARLAYESISDRFLEYLQKRYQIVVLNDSDFHVQVFIPNNQESIDFTEKWEEFIKDVVFSVNGDTKYNLPGLKHTLIQMLNSITLAGRGFSTLEIPIINKEQGNILAAWYFAVIRDVKKRQQIRKKQIENLERELKEEELTDKEQKSKEKDLTKKLEKQNEELQKYNDNFLKGLTKVLKEHQVNWQELKTINQQLNNDNLKNTQINKLQKQIEKLKYKIIFSEDFIEAKQILSTESEGDPFKFIDLDQKYNPNYFQYINSLAKNFNKVATEQINSTRGDIFTQCILEMYRLLENNKYAKYHPFPESVLREKITQKLLRSAGDDGKDFCYSCGTLLDAKTANWQVARFMFERPSQRRQSSSGEDRPYICHSCSSLAFVSPLKVTDESIILRLDPKDNRSESKDKLKDYLRMLTNKELHLCSGKYVILKTEKDSQGNIASNKLGQVQYALLKIASSLNLEVFTDFTFNLLFQGNKSKELLGRHLIFIKGLMEVYGQSIIAKGEINLKLGDAVRYVEKDLPFLADYTLAKISEISNQLLLEKVREKYWKILEQEDMERAKLYQDVAALTGLTYAFAQSLESTAKGYLKPEDVAREVSKLIEQVQDPVAFCYYATLGDAKKTSVQARLYANPDNSFIYEQTKNLLNKLKISLQERELKDDEGKKYLMLYEDDVKRAYEYFANSEIKNNYYQEKNWKELTYNVKLSLYTRFPELVRKLNKKGE